MDATFLADLVAELGQRGRGFLARGRGAAKDPEALCDALVSQKGEVTCIVLSQAILDHWDTLDEMGRIDFLTMMARRFGPDRDAVGEAVARFEADGDTDALYRLHRSSEPKAQKLIRRLNHAPQGTGRLVRMREVLLDAVAGRPELKNLDSDFSHLFASWFNRGFLELRRIDWRMPAVILEKIIHYEAVHEISDWGELRRRIAPPDRRLFAFFHPQMPDEPLIFVELALTDRVPGSMDSLLASDREEVARQKMSTAVFYSISNCQRGLRGVSFGNLLIKQVVEMLRAELPGLRNFVTLSPVPGFAAWLRRWIDETGRTFLPAQDLEALERLNRPGWHEDAEARGVLGPLLEGLASYYLLDQRDGRNRAVDPVARFHLGNGACLEAVHGFADTSAKGLGSACGLMVNYRYNLAEIEDNHEAYAERGVVAASSSVRSCHRKFLARMRNNPTSNSESKQIHVA